MRIGVTIDELVLIDVGTVDRHRFEAVFRHELARLLADSGLAMPPGSINRLDGGTVELDPAARPEVFATTLARAVYGAIAG
jgi:hypothetical protein